MAALAAGWIGAGPGLAADFALPRECIAAEQEAAGKIRALLWRQDIHATWLLGGSLAALKAARGDCAHGQTERAMLIYQRLLQALQADELARAPEVAATPPDDGLAGP